LVEELHREAGRFVVPGRKEVNKGELGDGGVARGRENHWGGTG